MSAVHLGMELDETLEPQADPHTPFQEGPVEEPERLSLRRGWDETPTDALKEPGGAIPDLPVWEEPGGAVRQPRQPAAPKEPLRLVPRGRDQSTAPLAASLTLRATASLVESAKLCEQLAYEWRASSVVPTLEGVVMRAAARAFREVWGTNALIGLRRIDGGSEQLSLAPDAAGQTFRQFIAELAAAPREHSDADFVVTSFLATAVEQADPRLGDGFFALTIGAEQVRVVLEQNVPQHARITTLSLAYTPESIPDGVAAALLTRICELVEAPYALLAD